MRPDFKRINNQISELMDLDEAVGRAGQQTEQLRQQAAEICRGRLKQQAAAHLKEISTEALKSSRAGIRTSVLTDAGFATLYDLYLAGDAELYALTGVAEKQVRQIRMITDGFLSELSGRERLRLPEKPGAPADDELITSLSRYRLARLAAQDLKGPGERLHAQLCGFIDGLKIRGRLRWFFSGAGKKAETLAAAEQLEAYASGQENARLHRLYGAFLAAVAISEDEAFADYEKNSAAYYALLEDLTGRSAPDELIYGSIPERLASEIRAEEVQLQDFRGSLRRYQLFGVKYILHQKRVLLGDEMGLGKTIQAIAAMVHLDAEKHGARFLIVCPASVMVNWVREIGRFSAIRAHLLHGAGLMDAFSAWEASGGAAVTNYESLRHLTDRIDGRILMDLMVIDEAHYIKNPEAQRTRYLKRLCDEASRLLLMTGTPLENRVHEMCGLIGFIRPELEEKARVFAALKETEAFREMLSPVYLRRQAAQVLDELPELIESEEWCTMTAADREAYVQEVMKRNFMAMRRVGFLAENPADASKAARLAELLADAESSGRRAVVYSYFRETLRKVSALISDRIAGEITGDTDPLLRQDIIDRFSDAAPGSALLCQIQAGGTGLNIQAASLVILCEPQIKPSLERQAVSRVYRMGQLHGVLVLHLLCEDTIDESIRGILEEKRQAFLTYADESALAEAEAGLEAGDWIRNAVEEQHSRYLPAVRAENGSASG